MSPDLLAELRADGVDVADDAVRDAILATLQARIIRLVTSEPAAFDRERYDRLMRAWATLRAAGGRRPVRHFKFTGRGQLFPS